MDALLEAGGVRSMFVGHDHGNFSLNINTQIKAMPCSEWMVALDSQDLFTISYKS